MKYQRNEDGIGYLKVSGATFKEKMGNEKILCDYCNKRLENNDEVVVIPFLNSAYCTECGNEMLEDCRPVGIEEEVYQVKKEAWFEEQFK